jgi:hypothetical protein
MVFSHIGFPRKYWFTVYVYDCSFVHGLFTLHLLDDNSILIIKINKNFILWLKGFKISIIDSLPLSVIQQSLPLSKIHQSTCHYHYHINMSLSLSHQPVTVIVTTTCHCHYHINLLLIYHHQLVPYHSSTMYQNLYHIMHHHVPKHVLYHASTMYQNM